MNFFSLISPLLCLFCFVFLSLPSYLFHSFIPIFPSIFYDISPSAVFSFSRQFSLLPLLFPHRLGFPDAMRIISSTLQPLEGLCRLPITTRPSLKFLQPQTLRRPLATPDDPGTPSDDPSTPPADPGTPPPPSRPRAASLPYPLNTLTSTP